jgi:hypothetical protein
LSASAPLNNMGFFLSRPQTGSNASTGSFTIQYMRISKHPGDT